MSHELAQRVGVIMVIGPVGIWVLSAAGFGVSIPGEHFATIIWAGVALIMGYDLRNLLGALPPPDPPTPPRTGGGNDNER